VSRAAAAFQELISAAVIFAAGAVEANAPTSDAVYVGLVEDYAQLGITGP